MLVSRLLVHWALLCASFRTGNFALGNRTPCAQATNFLVEIALVRYRRNRMKVARSAQLARIDVWPAVLIDGREPGTFESNLSVQSGLDFCA